MGIDLVGLGQRLRAQRLARGFSLEALAGTSGVSRSMVSEVERGEKTPTVMTLDRLATALGTSIARLLDDPARPAVTILRRDEQRVVGVESGWERRILSPVVAGVEFEFMRTTLPAGIDAGAFDAHPAGAHEYLAVEMGALALTVAGEAISLQSGDAIYYPGDQPHGFANVGIQPCVYYLAMSLGTAHRNGAKS